jgi:hypothetical protein
MVLCEVPSLLFKNDATGKSGGRKQEDPHTSETETSVIDQNGPQRLTPKREDQKLSIS